MNSRYRWARRRPGPILALPVALVVVIVTACSGTDDASPDDGTTSAPETPTDQTRDQDGPGFTEVAAASGLDETHSELELVAETSMTSGAAVADVDSDGDDDIFLPRAGKPNGLYLNDGDGEFSDVARTAGVAGPSERFGSSAAAFFDIEGDGDLDLFVTGHGQGRNELFVNDGSGRFTEESEQRGLVWDPIGEFGLGSQTHGVTVADVNLDGHMDLLVLQWYARIFDRTAASAEELEQEAPSDSTPCETAARLRAAGFPVDPSAEPSRSRLFLNDGAGGFRDATDEMGLPFGTIAAFTGIIHDLDDDGWPDLAVTGDGCTSRLYRNIGGERFEDITESSGVGTDENGMGAVVRDVNGDGRPDWFVTSIADLSVSDCPSNEFFGCSGNRLYVNEGDASFSDMTDRYGLRDGGWGWGAAIEDFSNDGQLEVIMTNGYDAGEPGTAQNPEFFEQFTTDRTRLWTIGGDDVAVASGIDDASIGHGLVPFDMDGDGDLDVLIVPINEEPLLFRNDTLDTHSWLTVSLDDPTTPGNRWGDGARIVVTPGPDASPITGWITTGGSYESQKPPEFHVGLGERVGSIDSIAVYWPGESTPQVLTDVEPRQHLVVSRG